MKPFWENEYLNKEKSTFGNPSKEVEDIVPHLKKDAKILDAGCGDGRHSVYLAGLGFQVDAFDISVNAINKIDYLKKNGNLNINTFVCDVLDFNFKYKYDLIIIHGVLQFIEKAKQPKIIELLKKWTNPNGYHIIALFTDEEPVPADLKDVMVGVFKEGEIKDYYKDWQIEAFESYKFHDEHESGIKHCHAVNKIIAQNINLENQNLKGDCPMKKKRLLYLILPVMTIILQILPYGAVLNFANPNGYPWRMTYSYFSLTPFGYASFSPLLTAISTCVVAVLLILYCFTGKDSIAKITKVLLCVAVALSLCPLVYGIKNYSVVGGLITVTLIAELLILHFTINKEQR